MTLLLALLLACDAVRTAAPTSAPPAAPTSAPPAAPAEAPASRDLDVAALKTTGLPVIDVRTPEEFAQGHVPGARNVPLDQLAARLPELEPLKGQEFAVICASGRRSLEATSTLHAAGFSGARNVLGGTRGWQAAGYPLE